MKKLCLLLVSLIGMTAALEAREVININRNWDFSFNQDVSARSRTTVDLPHTWNYDAISVRNSYQRGVANYIHSLNARSEWRNKRVYLRFNGVNSEANLFVNGHFAGAHKGGYTAFTFEITSFLRFGNPNNSIWVRVNNSPQLDAMPINGDFNIYGGIHRDVELIIVDPVHIAVSDDGADGVYIKQKKITKESAQVEAVVQLSGPQGNNSNYTVRVEVKEPDSDSIVAFREAKVRVDRNDGVATLPLTVNNPKLWNGLRDAYMYDFKIKVSDDKKIIDSLTVSSGFRFFGVTADKGFTLNGEHYEIHGVTYYGDRAGRGTAMRKRDYDADFDLMLEMGANAVRMTNYPQDKYFFDLCDRYGIIVWSEIPLVGQEMGTYNGFVNSQTFRNNCKAQLAEMVKQNYNHPSVVFWGLFSNLITRDDDPTDFVAELNMYLKSLDNTRLTAASSNQDGSINYITDVIGWSQYFGWKEGQVSDINIWLRQLRSEWSSLKSGIGEYGAGGSVTHVSDTLRRPNPRERLHPERWQSDFHEKFYSIISKTPYLWGNFIQTIFDYGSSGYWLGDTPGVKDMGLVTYDRRDKKDAFYFYKANWNKTEPFVYIADKRWDIRRSSSQTIRVYSNQDEVELIVNDESKGTKTGTNGVFTWSVRLKEGGNKVEAYSGNIGDITDVTISSRY